MLRDPTGPYFKLSQLPTIAAIQRAGITSMRGIAIALNARGVATARGGKWQVSNVRNVLSRQAGIGKAEPEH